ncbi:hypothetical protein Tco_0139248 [Tanacetum coccineum]
MLLSTRCVKKQIFERYVTAMMLFDENCKIPRSKLHSQMANFATCFQNLLLLIQLLLSDMELFLVHCYHPKEDLKHEDVATYLLLNSGLVIQILEAQCCSCVNHTPLPNHEQYMPEVRKELKICEAKTVEPSINELPEVELKELPPHLEYAFLEGDDKLPVIIAKDLKDEEKAALLKVLKSHKRAIAWKLSDIKGVKPDFVFTKILLEAGY